jgi:multiple sugar transport system permease protein
MKQPHRSKRFRSLRVAVLGPATLSAYVLFTAGPVLFALAASFTNWDLQHPVPFAFIGLENFRRLMGDEQFWVYFVNTIYLMLGLPISIAGALMLALLLSQKLRGMTVYRTLFYLPSFTSGVALMILWKKLYNPEYGPINSAIRTAFGALHIKAEAPNWLQSTQNLATLALGRVGLDSGKFGLGARDALIIMGIWIAIGGANMLLYLAALTNVPQDLYEAAEIDGAGKWKKFWNVTWPQLAPTTFFIVVMSFIGGLQGGFETARVMTEGGPAGTTTTLAYYIYIKAFEEFQMGYASAIAWMLFAIIFVVTMLNWKFGSRAMND